MLHRCCIDAVKANDDLEELCVILEHRCINIIFKMIYLSGMVKRVDKENLLEQTHQMVGQLVTMVASLAHKVDAIEKRLERVEETLERVEEGLGRVE